VLNAVKRSPSFQRMIEFKSEILLYWNHETNLPRLLELLASPVSTCRRV